jgi:hypothetical protein
MKGGMNNMNFQEMLVNELKENTQDVQLKVCHQLGVMVRDAFEANRFVNSYDGALFLLDAIKAYQKRSSN